MCRSFKIECHVEKNVHFRHLLHFAFNQCSEVVNSICMICAVYGEDDIVEYTACDCYAKFKNGNFDHTVSPHSGHKHSHKIPKQLAEEMDYFQTALYEHLYSMRKFSKAEYVFCIL